MRMGVTDGGAKGIEKIMDSSGNASTFTIEQGEWMWLTMHADSDRIIVIDQTLDLKVVVKAVIDDEVSKMAQWLDANLVAKPTFVQVEQWNENPKKKFRFSIVQPYVLVQEMPEMLH